MSGERYRLTWASSLLFLLQSLIVHNEANGFQFSFSDMTHQKCSGDIGRLFKMARVLPLCL
jgi:hypothetical protein